MMGKRFQVSAVLVCAALFGTVSTEPYARLAFSADTSGALSSNAAAMIPEEIIAEARRRQLPLASIKRQGNQWMACISGADSNESCLVLGQATSAKRLSRTSSTLPTAAQHLDNLHLGDVVQVQQYGEPLREVTLTRTATSTRAAGSDVSHVGRFVSTGDNRFSFQLAPNAEARVSVRGRAGEPVLDTLPRFRRESPLLVRTKDFQLVRQYIDAHPAEPFVVLVTVPALCEPCRQMDQVVHQAFASNQTQSLHSAAVKTFILEYFTFSDAEREVLGHGALFPTTMIYNPVVEPRRTVIRTIGSTQGISRDELSRTLVSKLKRGAPHTVGRGLISKDLLLDLIRVQ